MINWWEEKSKQTYEEPKNEERMQRQIREILDFAKSKARSTEQERIFDSGSRLDEGLKDRDIQIVNRLNEVYKSEVSREINNSNVATINKVRISNEYTDETQNELNTQLESRKQLFKTKAEEERARQFGERVEERKRGLFANPEEAIKFRRTFSSVQEYYELTDDELEKFKKLVGEDALR